MIRRSVLALALVLGVSAAPVAAPVAAQAPDRGTAGIGDPYFPLDGNGGIDVLRYDVHDRYSFEQGRLSGWTRVTLEATETMSGFNLDFLLPVTAVRVGGHDVRYDQRRFHELAVHHRVTEGERVELVIRYAGKPGRYAYAGESNWLAGDHEVVAMNQPHMAPWWFPANDHPRDRARISISITVPKDNEVIANGDLVDRAVDGRLATTTWRADEPMVPYLAFFAAGDFRVATGTADTGLPWVVAVSKGFGPEQESAAMRLMKRTPELLSWLETALGADYPFSTSGGLTTGLPVGFALENQTRPTYPFMGEGLGAVQTVVHELAHQWFGDVVTVQGWKDIWLNEGPATFFEAYYNEDEHGVPADTWLHNTYDRYSAEFWNHEVADPCADHQGCVDDIFASFVYDRGGMTLQALRNVVGDDDFFELLRRWVTDRAGSTGTTAQFEALAEEVTGQDLGDFFDVWLHTPEKPAETAANGLA